MIRVRPRQRKGKKRAPARFKRFWFYSCWRKLSNVGGYKINAWYNLSWLLQSCCHLNAKEELSVTSKLSETYSVTNQGSGWRRDVVNQWSEFQLAQRYAGRPWLCSSGNVSTCFSCGTSKWPRRAAGQPRRLAVLCTVSCPGNRHRRYEFKIQ